MKNACQRGYATLDEAKAAFRQLSLEGAIQAVPDPDAPGDEPADPDDDVPVTPSAASRAARSARGSTKHARSTPASSASRTPRDSPARERAPPTPAPRSPSTRSSATPTPSEDGGSSRRARGPHPRHDERSPSRARVKHERADDPRRTPRAQTSASRRAQSPVVVPTDTDSEGPPPSSARTSARSRKGRSRRIVQEYASSDESDDLYETVPPSPAWDEGISYCSSLKTETPRLTRSNTHTTSQYETASDAPQQDEPGSAQSSRSSSSVSTSSSPPTGVSQYEDPEGKHPFHEFRAAERKKAKRDAAVRVALHVAASRAEPHGADNDAQPRTRKASTHGAATPARTAVPQRSRTEPASSPAHAHSPRTPTARPLTKSQSAPAAAPATPEARLSFTFRVCRSCSQPAPDPPLAAPVGGTGLHCSRCLQPMADASISSASSPRALRKSATHDGAYSRRPPASDTSSDVSQDVPSVGSEPAGQAPKEGEDVFGFYGLSSALSQRVSTVRGSRGLRSNARASASFPVRSSSFLRCASPAPSSDGSLSCGLHRSDIIG